MITVKFTKGELKKQRDDLGQFQRYLPALQLKKQQLQIEILHQLNFLEEKSSQEKAALRSVYGWAGLLADQESDPVRSKTLEVTAPHLAVISHGVNLPLALKIKQVVLEARNIAGIDFPVFKSVEFQEHEYDLFLAPLWVDSALETLKVIIALRKEREVLESALTILRSELRIVAQRVNLFEKVKIPEAKENIRMIKIYLGDQLANAVGRSKIAKRKIERLILEEALV